MMGVSTIELLILLFYGWGAVGVPLGMPPGPEDPVMAAIAPEECFAYTTWAAAVEPDPNANPVEAWLSQPEIGKSWNHLIEAYRGYCLAQVPAELEATVDQAFDLSRHLISHAGAMYVADFAVTYPEDRAPTITFAGGMVVHVGNDRARFTAMIDHLSGFILQRLRSVRAMTDVESLTIQGKPFSMVTIPGSDEEHEWFVTWGMIDESHFAITLGQGEMERLVQRSITAMPAWLASARERLSVPRISSVSMLDAGAAIAIFADSMAWNERDRAEARKAMQGLGIDQLGRIHLVTGLDDKGCVARMFQEIEGEPRGLFGLFSERVLVPEDLGKVPADSMVAAAMATSPARVLAMARELMALSPDGGRRLEAELDAMEASLGIQLSEDLLDQLDDVTLFYGSVNLANPTAGWLLGFGASNEMSLADPVLTLSESLQRLAESSRNEYQDGEVTRSDVNGVEVFTYRDRSEWAFPAEVSWALAEGELLLSYDTTTVRRHIRRVSMDESSIANDAWFRDVFEAMPGDANGPSLVYTLDAAKFMKIVVPMVSLFSDGFFDPEFDFAFSDLPSLDVLTSGARPILVSGYRVAGGFEFRQRQTWPGGSPLNGLPAVAAASLPVAIASLDSMEVQQMTSHQREIVIAMHNYYDAYQRLPARYTVSNEGQPLLSWRVQLLPYLGYSELYDQFHLDEPWDSEHNLKLVDQIPSYYQTSAVSGLTGKTPFVVPIGASSAIVDPDIEDGRVEGRRFESVRDGTSGTLAVLVADPENAVIWTAPDDYEWENREDPISGLATTSRELIPLSLLDGSVRVITEEGMRKGFQRLVDVADGERFDFENHMRPLPSPGFNPFLLGGPGAIFGMQGGMEPMAIPMEAVPVDDVPDGVQFDKMPN